MFSTISGVSVSHLPSRYGISFSLKLKMGGIAYHTLIALGLLGQLGEINSVFLTHCEIF
jgi:hypothetical protein